MYVPPAPTDPPLPIPSGCEALESLAPGRVLVVRLGRLGDVLLTTPTLRALRRRFPAARVDVLTGPAAAPLLRGNPDVDEVLAPDGVPAAMRVARAGRYDLVLDLQRSAASSAVLAGSGAPARVGRPAGRWHDAALTHRVPAQRAYSAHFQASVLRVFGVEEVDLDLRLAIDPGHVEEAVAALAALPGEGPRVALAPGSRSPTRRWPRERWIELARALRDAGTAPVVLWGPGEEEDAHAIAAATDTPMAPPTDVPTLAAWIAATRVLVGNCSLPRHLAVAAKVPTIVMHGASSVGGWTRPSAWHRALHGDPPCRPCHREVCTIGLPCLLDVTADHVVPLVHAALALPSEPPLVVRVLPARAPVG